MRFLVLGGTAWLGGYIASTALELDHQVTCLARGVSGSVPAGAAFVRADRDRPKAYDEVAGEHWDVVVDVSRQPGQVRRAAATLVDHSSSFVFVSSGNVYADHRSPGQDEMAPLLPPLAGDVMEATETYGEAKVACEQHAVEAYGVERTLIARVGLIGGPGDISDRTGYWPLRFARPAGEDGSVLVSDAPEDHTQVIDVRDLARWMVEAGSRGVHGAFNATGETMPLAQHLQVARTVAGHRRALVAAAPEWLLARHVQPWMGERSLPLWVGDPDWAGFNTRDSSKARAAGLRTRALEETLTDGLMWETTRDRSQPRGAGLSDHDERSLLLELATS